MSLARRAQNQGYTAIEDSIKSRDSAHVGTNNAVKNLEVHHVATLTDLRGRIVRCDSAISKLSTDVRSCFDSIRQLNHQQQELSNRMMDRMHGIEQQLIAINNQVERSSGESRMKLQHLEGDTNTQMSMIDAKSRQLVDEVKTMIEALRSASAAERERMEQRLMNLIEKSGASRDLLLEKVDKRLDEMQYGVEARLIKLEEAILDSRNQITDVQTNWDHWNCILDYAKLVEAKRRQNQLAEMRFRAAKIVGHIAPHTTPGQAWVNYGQREPTVYLVDVNGHQIKMDIKHTRPGSATSVGMSSKDEPATLASLQARVRQLEKDALEERLSEVSLAASAATHGDTVNTVTGAGDDGGVVGRKGQPQGLSETLKAKDHYIEQLEKQLATTQGEANKTRIRLKKRIKTLTAQINEAKQESSIAHLEMRERQEEDKLDHDGKGCPASHSPASLAPDEEGRQSKMKVILNLSAQVSEQAEKIARLEKDLEERDSEIRMLMEDYALDEDKWSLATDDNDLMFTAEASLSRNGSAKQKRKSALKSKLERTRNERSKALMGPSLAFAASPQDQLADTSSGLSAVMK
nr:hypothetical protein BaRGS_014477 [Batillaria attramentaria]